VIGRGGTGEFSPAGFFAVMGSFSWMNLFDTPCTDIFFSTSESFYIKLWYISKRADGHKTACGNWSVSFEFCKNGAKIIKKGKISKHRQNKKNLTYFVDHSIEKTPELKIRRSVYCFYLPSWKCTSTTSIPCAHQLKVESPIRLIYIFMVPALGKVHWVTNCILAWGLIDK